MRSHPFFGRPVRDIDSGHEMLAQHAALVRHETHGRHLNTRARRARIHQTTQWWTPLFQAAIDPKERQP